MRRWTSLLKKKARSLARRRKSESDAAQTERTCQFETMEPRRVLSANPVVVGAVYIEDDSGTDSQADQIYISFEGGEATTRLSRIVINTSQDGNDSALGEPDVYFDTERGPSIDRGSGGFHPFSVSPKSQGISSDDVTWSLTNDGTKLIVDVDDFRAGDRLVISIDVDQYFANKPDDQITSGIEFAGSQIETTFIDNHYDFHASNDPQDGVFQYTFGFGADDIDDSGILSNLPSYQHRTADGNFQSIENRTAGAEQHLTLTPKPVTISGTVFHDRDLNLMQDIGDEGIEGVVLRLQVKDGAGNYVDIPSGNSSTTTTTTDANGFYIFDESLNLQPGTYRVLEVQPSDFEFSVGEIPGTVEFNPVGIDPVGDNVLSEILIPLGDQHAINYDFAEARGASLCGYVYHDRNDNGLREAGEEGLAGVQLRIIPKQTIASQAEVLVVTDADGRYCALGLAPGEYEVVELATPAGFQDGKDTPGTVDGSPLGMADNPGDRIYGIMLSSGSKGDNYNFGEVKFGSLSGYVFLGTPEGDCVGPGHPEYRPIAGVEVRLTNNSGQSWTVQTGADGRYEFNGLTPDTYTITQITHPDFPYLNGDNHIGTIDGVQVGRNDVVDQFDQIAIGAGDNGVDYNFCEHEPASLSGHVFHDRDNDGVRESGEEGIAQVRIDLYDAQGVLVDTVMTDDLGGYQFTGLYAGQYTIRETQPETYVDGLDQAGTIDGQTVGTAYSDLDEIRGIDLLGGQHGIDFDFGEYRLSSIEGIVFQDFGFDCQIQPDYVPIVSVRVELLNEQADVIDWTITDDQGRYRFNTLNPGTYAVRQIHPDGLFQGGQTVGTESGSSDPGPGDAGTRDLIHSISISSGTHLVDYNFCDVPPATLSGFVYQDGAPIYTIDGEIPSPERLLELRDGQLTADDARLGGVVLELRNGITGRPIQYDEVLPGQYPSGPIRTVTDANGYYEFRGLPAGNYAVFQIQPDGYIDHVDTPGTTDGIAFNATSVISPSIIDSFDSGVTPGTDAIVRIAVGPGQTSAENNFSEVIVSELPPPPPETPITPTDTTPRLNGFLPPPLATYAGQLPVRTADPVIYRGAGGPDYSWHLSIIDGGTPRGRGDYLVGNDEAMRNVTFVANRRWDEVNVDGGRWIITTNDPEESPTVWDTREYLFGRSLGIPIVGDFNGDGMDEVAIYHDGHWFLDLNGNGQWDSNDLWAQLGNDMDLPVTGDWDGDGKEDIGIFGPMWPGDPRHIANEPGLPDPDNAPISRAKNVPLTETDATQGKRIMRLTSTGENQADVIDHVFRYGEGDDTPIAGDWNGDGIRGIGVFNSGVWKLDLNGNGRWDANDAAIQFGEEGDIPVVGDFNGDGIEEIGVFRAGTWILDINGNRELDAHDAYFALGEVGDVPLAGDFDGDGIDEPILYRPIDPIGP